MARMTPVDIARWITAIVFVVIGVTHFIPPVVRGMAAMVPAVFHGRPFSAVGWVWVTGVAEIAGGLGLLWEPTRAAAGIALAVFLVCVFPANAHAAGKREKFGVFAVPFWPRLAMQLALIAIVLWVGLAP
ncbi:putative membrane protein [Microcella alkaliphila]|uniref:Putative membrane protein n=2 Tax=Microcella alkaliphila TaxID=279828 RepID=A0A4Q7TEZ3_9MICO|nr:putative membrane protein [Microcella alkaliphila]